MQTWRNDSTDCWSFGEKGTSSLFFRTNSMFCSTCSSRIRAFWSHQKDNSYRINYITSQPWRQYKQSINNVGEFTKAYKGAITVPNILFHIIVLFEFPSHNFGNTILQDGWPGWTQAWNNISTACISIWQPEYWDHTCLPKYFNELWPTNEEISR